MKSRNMLQSIRDFLWERKLDRQRRLIEKAAQKLAENTGDAEYERIMANFHTERVLEIDHNVDWWEFAAQKQKQYDHQNNCISYEQKAEEARAEFQASMSRLKRMRFGDASE